MVSSSSSHDQMAEGRGVGVEEVEKEVKLLLDEIGHKFYLPAVRTLAFILRGPIRRVIRSINVSAGGLEKVRLGRVVAVCLSICLFISGAGECLAVAGAAPPISQELP